MESQEILLKCWSLMRMEDLIYRQKSRVFRFLFSENLILCLLQSYGNPSTSNNNNNNNNNSYYYYYCYYYYYYAFHKDKKSLKIKIRQQ